MFAFLCAFVVSEVGTGCPPATRYLFDETVEIELEPRSWYYFYTSHALREEPLFYEIRSETPVKVYVSRKPKCPKEEDTPLAEVEGGNKSSSILVENESEMGIIVSGIYSEEGTKLRLKLLGQATKKRSGHPLIKLLLIFIAMSGAAITFFVKCVLPPLPKEKQD